MRALKCGREGRKGKHAMHLSSSSLPFTIEHKVSFYVCVCVYIYIYIYKEKGEGDGSSQMCREKGKTCDALFLLLLSLRN